MIQTIYQYIAALEGYGDRTAYQYNNADRSRLIQVTFIEFAHDVRRYAGYLQTLGLRDKAHVGILADNSYDYSAAIFAVMLADMVVVPLNNHETMETLTREITLADIDLLLVDENMKATAESILPGHVGMLSDYQPHTQEGEVKDCEDPAGLAMILFTSGTTGAGKGVMLTQLSLTAAGEGICQLLMPYLCNLGENNRTMMLMMPLYHVAGLGITMGMHWLGGRLDLCGSFKYLAADIVRFGSGVTVIPPVVATMFSRMLPVRGGKGLGALRFVYITGAQVSKELLTAYIDSGITAGQMYGLTETGGAAIAINHRDHHHVGSVGRPYDRVEVMIENGEICMKGDPVMLGYYKDPESTARVLKDGWFHSGDLGYRDGEGYVYLTGRCNNVIILSGGENVSPEELEAGLSGCEAVQESLVYGEQDRICADIYCAPEAQETVQEFIRHYNQTLPMHKRIQRVVFTQAELPKTASGKIARKRG